VSTATSAQVCYLLKRFPRLSETFILNEVRALERLGTNLVIVSLLPREAGLAHSTVEEVRATTYYVPDRWPTLLWAAIGSHMAVATKSPAQYLTVARRALWLGIRYGHPTETLKNFLRAGLVAETCRQHSVRHIHAHFANTPTGVAHFLSMLTGLPFSFTTHAKDLYLTPTAITRERVAAARFVVTCTKYNLEFLKRFVEQEHWRKLHLVYHGADLSAFSGLLGQDPRPAGAGMGTVPIVLSVGRLVPKKGMKTLIEGCALLRDHGVEFECRIVGNGPLRSDLEEQIVRLELAGTVTLMGAMTHDRLVEIYGQATVFALVPQITEEGDRDGIPNVLVEAMAAGVPVVSTSVSGIPELVEDGRTGLLVRPGDAAAAAAAVERLLRDSKLRQEIVTAARRQLKQSFECWESTKAIHALLAEGTTS
jgi:glycosyltransferase involved in cell wall biosynthesis